MPQDKTKLIGNKPVTEQPGITSLGKDNQIDEELLDTESENPLDKMDKVAKEKDDSKKDSDTSLDSDLIEEMLMTGENTEGMFIPDEQKPDVGEPPIHAEKDEDAKLKIKANESKPSKKYEKDFKNDMLKHPDDYKLNTPRGEMTVAEAIKAGYNPITKRFEKDKTPDSIKKKHLDRLNDEDRTAIERITSPSSAGVAPADAGMYGLAENSPMVQQPMSGMMPPASKNQMAQAPIPEQGAMPGQEPNVTQPTEGGGIEQLLGGM